MRNRGSKKTRRILTWFSLVAAVIVFFAACEGTTGLLGRFADNQRNNGGSRPYTDGEGRARHVWVWRRYWRRH